MYLEPFLLFCIYFLVATSFTISINEQHQPSNPCQKHFNGTLLQHPNNCHKFFVCINSQPQEYYCETNFHFDFNTKSCIIGNDCNDINQSPEPSQCTEGDIKPIANNCYMFEVCIKGQYHKLTCPSGNYFSVPHYTCQAIEFNANYKCRCLVPEHTVLPNRQNCQTYFVCKEGRAFLQKCASGQHYEHSVNKCLPDEQGVCVMQPTKVPLNEKSPKFSKHLY